jgi:hypothetical protein
MEKKDKGKRKDEEMKGREIKRIKREWEKENTKYKCEEFKKQFHEIFDPRCFSFLETS